MKKITHIAVDCNEANVKDRVGSNVYAFEILKALYALLSNRNDITITLLHTFPLVADMPPQNERWRYVQLAPTRFWTQWALPKYLFKYRHEINVFFSPGHYAPRFTPIPYVSCVMDLGFEVFPSEYRRSDLFQLKNWTRYSVKNAKKVIAISEFTKNEIHRLYKKSLDTINVAYPGKPTVSVLKSNSQNALLEKMNIFEKYFLYVGTIQPRKNLPLLINAFEEFVKNEQIANSTSIPHLVIAGKIGWLANETLNKIEKSSASSRIHLIGYVNDQEKNTLYQHSLATILPGKYEGFGIPPLEAMNNGTIALVARAGSLPEVVGSAGMLFDQSNSAELTSLLKLVTHMSKSKRNEIIKRGKAVAATFSWKISAEIVLNTLLSVIKLEERKHQNV